MPLTSDSWEKQNKTKNSTAQLLVEFFFRYIRESIDSDANEKVDNQLTCTFSFTTCIQLLTKSFDSTMVPSWVLIDSVLIPLDSCALFFRLEDYVVLHVM